MFYELHVMVGKCSTAYNMTAQQQEFIRYRRWSAFNELRKQVEPLLTNNHYSVQVGEDLLGGPFLCPSESKIFANRSSVAAKRSVAFGEWL